MKGDIEYIKLIHAKEPSEKMFSTKPNNSKGIYKILKYNKD